MANEELLALRGQIDDTDRRFLQILAERFLLTHQVGKLKARHGLPVYDPVREAEKLASLEQYWRQIRQSEHPDERLVRNVFPPIMLVAKENHDRLRRELIPMKIFTIGFQNYDILVRVAQKDSDRAELQTLMSQTQSLSRISGGKTGLHLVDSFEQEGAFHVMLVLNKGLTLNSEEIEKLRALVLQQEAQVA